MLFLLSIALVIGALILLILGFAVDHGLNLIYASIAASVVAFIALFFSIRLDRERPVALATGSTALLDPEGATELAATANGERVSEEAATGEAAISEAAISAPSAVEVAPTIIAPAPTVAVELEAVPADEQWAPAEQDEAGASELMESEEWSATAPADGGWADDDFFPIADYDELTVQEILPLLPQLYPEEIPVVEDRERATKRRSVILDTLADLRSEVPGSAPAAEPASTQEWAAPSAADAAFSDLPFPIEDYDDLTAPSIIGVLDQLEADELEEVRAYEATHTDRRTVLAAIDRLSPVAGSAADSSSTKAAAGAKKAAKRTAPKAPAKKTTGDKSSAKKAPAKKATAASKRSAKKAPAKKATSSKAAVKKAPAKTTAAEKSAAKKAPAKKATSSKAAAKKAPATKTAAKKTTAKKSSTKRR